MSTTQQDAIPESTPNNNKKPTPTPENNMSPPGPNPNIMQPQQGLDNSAENTAQDDDKDEAQAQQSSAPTPSSEGGKDKKEKKDPMMELVDDLQNFVGKTNKDITDFITQNGKQQWDNVQNTGPAKTLSSALGKASDFLNDKMDQTTMNAKNSKAGQSLDDAAKFVQDVQKTITSSLGKVMQSAANAIDKGVDKMTSPKNSSPSNSNAASSGPTPGDDDEGQLADSPGMTDIAGDKPDSSSDAQLSQGPDTPSTPLAASNALPSADLDSANNTTQSPSPAPDSSPDNDLTKTGGLAMGGM
jgi:hypothetical protein